MDREAWQAILHGVTKSLTQVTNTSLLYYTPGWLKLRLTTPNVGKYVEQPELSYPVGGV